MTGIGIGPGLGIVGIGSSGFSYEDYSPLSTSIEMNNGTSNENVKFDENASRTFLASEPNSHVIWVKHTTTTTQTFIANHAGGGGQSAWLLTYETSTGGLRAYRGTAAGATYWDYTVDTSDGSWHCLILTDDGTSGIPTLYVDGNEATQSGSGSGWPSGNTPDGGRGVTFGAYWYFGGGTKTLSGRVCHCAVYDKELSSSEASAIHNQGTPANIGSGGASDNLVLWCTLGNGCAIGTDNMIDLSDTADNGTYISGDSGDFVSDVPP
jgi:hypothetical protein